MIGPISWLLLTLTIQVTVLAIAIYAIQRLTLARNPKAAARLIAFGMLLLLAVSAAVTLPVPSWLDLVSQSADQIDSQDLPAEPSLAAMARNQITSEPIFDDTLATGGPIAWGDFVKQLAGEFTDAAVIDSTDRSRSMAWNGVVCFGICFLSLCVFGFGRLLLGFFSLRRLRLNSRAASCELTLAMSTELRDRIGCQRDIKILLSPLVGTAATIGLWNPKIFLADDFESWGQSEQKSVLAHEIAHIHHGDFAANIISQICTSMHFFNPAVHWLVGQMRLNQEVAADQIASQITSGTDEYTRTLAALALRQDNHNKLRLASMFIPNENSFIRRIRMLKHANRNRSAAVSWATLLATLITAFVISGIRAPTSTSASTPTLASGEAQDSQEKNDAFNTGYIGDIPDQMVTFFRPSKLNRSAIVRKFTNIKPFDQGVMQMDKVFEEFTGIGTEHIEQVANVSSMNANEALDRNYAIVRTYENNLENFKNLGEIAGDASSFPMRIKHGKTRSVMKFGMILDERTILWAYSEKGVENAREFGLNSAQRASWYPEFKEMAKRSVVVVGDSDILFATGSFAFPGVLSTVQADLFVKSNSFVMAADANNSIAFTLRFKFPSGADARSAQESVDDIKKSCSKLLWEMLRSPDEPRKSLATSAVNSIKALEGKVFHNTLELKSTFDIDMKAIKAVSGELDKAAAKTEGMTSMHNLALALQIPVANIDASASEFSQLANKALINKDFSEAILYYEKAREKSPKDAAILNNLAFTYIVAPDDDRNSELALQLVDEAIANLPEDIKPREKSKFLHTKAAVLMALGRLEEASALYERVLEVRPDHADSLRLVIECYLALDLQPPEQYVERLEKIDQEKKRGEK